MNQVRRRPWLTPAQGYSNPGIPVHLWYSRTLKEFAKAPANHGQRFQRYDSFIPKSPGWQQPWAEISERFQRFCGLNATEPTRPKLKREDGCKLRANVVRREAGTTAKQWQRAKTICRACSVKSLLITEGHKRIQLVLQIAGEEIAS